MTLTFFYLFIPPPLRRGVYRYALVCPFACLYFCDKDGNMGASVSYGYISSLYKSGDCYVFTNNNSNNNQLLLRLDL